MKAHSSADPGESRWACMRDWVVGGGIGLLIAAVADRFDTRLIADALLVALGSGAFLLPLFPGLWRRRVPRPRPAILDLPRRRIAWSVLSDLYLDTWFDDGQMASMASRLAATGYSIGELEEILYRELHPHLITNLLSVAGEWAGFDMDWLEAKILASHRWGIGTAIVPGMWMVRGEWKTLERLVREQPASVSRRPRA